MRENLLMVDNVELNAALSLSFEDVLAESHKLSNALNAINASINSTLDFDEIMQRVIDKAANAIGTETGALIFREGEHWLTKYSYGYEENILGVILTDEEAPHAALAARLKKPVVINDAYNDPQVNLKIMKRYSIRSVITVPLMAKGTTIGILFLNYHSMPVAFTEAQVDFANKLSAAVSLAIENARLHKQTEEELARTQLLQDVAVAATTGPDLYVISNEIFQALNEHIHLKMGIIYRHNEQKQVFHAFSQLNFTADAIAKIKEFSISSEEFLSPKAVKADRILTHKEDTLSPERIAFLKQIGAWYTRYAAIPIKYRGKVTGILFLTFEGRRDFTQEELALFNSVAHIAGQVMENARLYEAEKKRAAELAEHRSNLEKTIQKRTKEISEINARLRQSEAQHRQIIEASPDAYFVLTQDRILFANTAARQLFGYEMSGEIDVAALKKKLEENFLPRTVEISLIPVVIEDEPATQYIVRDITQRKEMEKEMARLDRLNLIGEMAAGIGHEVRNPMTSVRGFLQLLQNEEPDAKKLGYYDIMIEELDRANSIITEYLSLAKDRAVKLTPASLNSIIDSLYPLLTTDAAKQDKRIMLRKEDIPDILLNEKEIRQLIINLVRNGLEAMPSGGCLSIGTYDGKDEVVLFVEDEGTGIKPEIYKKLGTPFVTTKDYGTGLGLPVCYSISEKHNAKIDVKTGSAGTTFYVRFKKEKI